jgi:hypothetical protein
MLARGDHAEARRFAHTLKGVSGSLELPDVQAIAAEIERRIAAEDLAGIDSRITELEAKIAPAIAAALSLKADRLVVRDDKGPALADPAEVAAAPRGCATRFSAAVSRRGPASIRWPRPWGCRRRPSPTIPAQGAGKAQLRSGADAARCRAGLARPRDRPGSERHHEQLDRQHHPPRVHFDRGR